MPRKYTHISNYETEIISMWKNGKTLREIAESFGFTLEQVKEFKKRYNRKQRMLEAGKTVRRKGRPCKKDRELPPSIKSLDQLAQMRYVMASKDRYIKELEMKVELLQDFLLLTERK